MKKVKQIFAMFAVMLLVASPAFAGSGNTIIKQGAGKAMTLATIAALSVKKSDGTEFSAEEKEMLLAVQAITDKANTGAITKAEMEEAIEALKGTFTTPEQVSKIDNALTELKEAMVIQGNVLRELQGGNLNSKADSLVKMIAEKLNAENGDGSELSRKQLFSNKSGELRIALKAPINIGIADTLVPVGGNMIVTPPQEMNRIIDYVTVDRNTNGKSGETFVEQYDEDGNAEIVPCGGLKPLITAKFRKQIETPIKIAAHTKECDDILFYVDGLEAVLRDVLLRKINDARDAAIVTLINGVANLYNLTTINTTDPTNYDAIRAAIAQVRSLNHKPTHVFLNPIDAANFEMSKGTDGHYLYVCTCGEGGVMNISSLEVVETNQIPVGEFLLGDLSRVRVKLLSDVLIRMGYGITVTGTVVTDDNIHDIVTIVAEQFLIMHINQLDSNAFVRDTFANVIAAI